MSDYLTDTYGSDDQPWMQHPARPCAQGDPERYFPSRQISDDEAAALCHGCPVINKCGGYAIPLPELGGIWGGLTEDGRKTLRRRGEAA